MNRGTGLTHSQQGGYTIVEVLIFLAVSALMFVAALMLIGGQQNRAQFTVAVREFQSQINDISNNIATGFYERPVDFTCSAGGASNPSFTAGGSQLGTNGQCIYIGTVLKFGQNAEAYQRFTMVGKRLAASGGVASTMAQAQPVPLFGGGVGSSAVVSRPLLYGATVRCVAIGNSCNVGTDTGRSAVGFFGSVDQATGQGGLVRTDAVLYNNTSLSDSTATTVTNITGVGNMGLSANNIPPLTDSITICLQSGSTNEYALIRIGGARSSATNVTSEVKSTSGGTLCS